MFATADLKVFVLRIRIRCGRNQTAVHRHVALELTQVSHGSLEIILGDLSITIGIDQRKCLFELLDPAQFAQTESASFRRFIVPDTSLLLRIEELEYTPASFSWVSSAACSSSGSRR